MKPIIAPSILSADFGYLAKYIEMVNRSERRNGYILILWTGYLSLTSHSAFRY